MDLNVLVGIPDKITGPCEPQSVGPFGPFTHLDPRDRSILPLAPCLRQRFRSSVEGRMQVYGNSTILGLDFGLVGSSGIPPVFRTLTPCSMSQMPTPTSPTQRSSAIPGRAGSVDGVIQLTATRSLPARLRKTSKSPIPSPTGS